MDMNILKKALQKLGTKKAAIEMELKLQKREVECECQCCDCWFLENYW